MVNKKKVPAWIERTANTVMASVNQPQEDTPIGYACGKDREGTWLLIFFPEPIDIVGGPRDGAVMLSNVEWNIGEILSVFTNVERVLWSSRCPPYNKMHGPHFCALGSIGDRDVEVLCLLYPPDGYVPKLFSGVDGVLKRR